MSSGSDEIRPVRSTRVSDAHSSRSTRKSEGQKRSSSGKYKFTSSVAESVTAGERQATYGVAFAWRPGKEYLHGGGSFWKGRRTLKPDSKSLAGQAKGSNGKYLDGEDDDEDDDDDDDDEEEDEEEEEEIDGANNSKEGEDDEVQAVNVDEDDLDDLTPINRRRSISRRVRDEDDSASIWRNLFVTCNGNAVRIYEAKPRQKPRVLQQYEDEDASEQFYCVGWTYNVDGNHEWWACAAGCKGVLRVINVHNAKLRTSLIGHGEAINDLKVHPRDPALVLTASKDESLRLWNLRTGATVVVFAGLKGHRGEVVFADFIRDGSKFASCGIDNSIRLWDIYDDDKVVSAIKQSHKIADMLLMDRDEDGIENTSDAYVYKDETGTRRKVKITISQFPYFVTRKVHKHYVDCVMWVGDLLLSKSVHNRMFLWEPEADRESLASPSCNYSLLEEYVLDVCNVWFIRFAMDRRRQLVACGNDKGLVSIFNLNDVPSKVFCTVQPNNKTHYNSQFVRQCAFSDDGSILIAVDDTASVVQYERI